MARIIATGPAPASRAARIGGAFGQGLNVGALGGLEQFQQEQQMQEQADPIRAALTSILQQQGALGPGGLEQVASSAVSNPLAFALQGGGGQGTTPPAQMPPQPTTPPAAPQPTGQGTQQQQLLARIQQDPAAFARLFADQGIEGVMGMAAPAGQAAPVRGQPGDVFFDPTTGQEVFSVPETPEPGTRTRVYSGDTEIGQSLGIPQGERARVEETVNEQGNIVERSVQGRFGAGQQITINNARADAYQEANADVVSGAVERTVQAGETASRMLPNLRRSGDLLAEGLNTGRGQALLLPLRQLASDFGFSVENIAAPLGIDVSGSTLADQEEFDRLAKQIVLESYAKTKGNLNAQEATVVERSVNNLGESEEANKRAIAMLQAAAEMAAQTGQQALVRGGSYDSAVEFLSSRAGGDSEALEARAQEILQGMEGGGQQARQAQPAAQPTPTGQERPQLRLPPELEQQGVTQEQIEQAVPQQFQDLGFQLGERLPNGNWSVVNERGEEIGEIQIQP